MHASPLFKPAQRRLVRLRSNHVLGSGRVHKRRDRLVYRRRQAVALYMATVMVEDVAVEEVSAVPPIKDALLPLIIAILVNLAVLPVILL